MGAAAASETRLYRIVVVVVVALASQMRVGSLQLLLGRLTLPLVSSSWTSSEKI